MASPTYGSRPAAGNDVYTILLAIGVASVGFALGFVIYRCTELLGNWAPSLA